MKLLIAAADAALRRRLAAPLAGAGHDVMEVEQGAAAWAALRAEGGPRLALLGLDMPDFGGLEVCRRLRRSELESARGPLILVVGHEPAQDLAAAISAGADDAIRLPIADELLVARIAQAQRVLELHDDRARLRAYLRALLSGVSNGVLLSDGAGFIVLANDALGEILGAELHGALARPRADFLAEQAERLEPRADWLQALRPGQSHDHAPLEFEVAALPTSRVVRWASQSIALPEGVGRLDVFRDISLELEVQQDRELMAMVDPVTGLYSRRGAEDTIERELARARRNGTKLSVVLFAVIGSDDETLRRVGDVLSLTARMTDITVRWADDQLLAVLPETALGNAAAFAERVCTSVRTREPDRAAAVTLSVGTAEYDPSEPDLTAAAARAEQALQAIPSE